MGSREFAGRILSFVVGYSAVVDLVAGLIHTARRKNPPATVVEFNLTETEATPLVGAERYGPSGETLPRPLTELGWD